MKEIKRSLSAVRADRQRPRTCLLQSILVSSAEAKTGCLGGYGILPYGSQCGRERVICH